MGKKIFIAIFIGLLLFPFGAMSIYHADLSIEKKHASSFPSPVEKGTLNLSFFSEVTDYMADYFAFRQELVTLDSQVKAKVFQTSGNEKVVVGKEGWLFFQETMDDYMGRNVLSKRELHNCAKVLELIQQSVVKSGAQFVFTIAPNKNSLYGEYMPERYLPLQDTGNLEGLCREMKQHEVNYVDLFSVLNQAKEQESVQIYHKLDTHWNNLGASVACDSLLTELGRVHTDYRNISYTIEKNFSADLQGMLYPKSRKKDENVIYKNKLTYDYVGEVESTEEIEIETINETKEHSLVMFRDSFGNALLPFMAQEYGSGYFTKEVPVDVSLIQEHKADDVVIELAQRQIPTLLEGVPYMMAPGVSFEGDVKEPKHSRTTMETEDLDGVLRVSGELDKRLMDEDSDVYISMYGKKNLLMFEAFPTVYDATDETVDRAYSYGAYIDTGSMEKDEYQIEIITKKGDAYYTSGFLDTYMVK